MSQYHALVIHLQATEDATLPATQGHLAHAAFLALVCEANPELAQALHDRKDRKPFTLSPVWGLNAAHKGRHAVRSGQELRLRLTILEETLFAAFLKKLLHGPLPSFRLGRAHFMITQVIGAPGSDDWAGFATEHDLVRQAGLARCISMTFASPMALGLGRANSGKVRREVLPIPRYVWASLRGSWQAFADGCISADLEDWVERNVVTARVDAWRTVMFRYGERKLQVGGLGRVTYKALDDAADMLRLWNRLAAFAFYCGVGVKTSMGMGVVRAEFLSTERNDGTA